MASWRSTRSSLRKTSWTRSGTSAPIRTREERKRRSRRPWVFSRSVTKVRRGSLLKVRRFRKGSSHGIRALQQGRGTLAGELFLLQFSWYPNFPEEAHGGHPDRVGRDSPQAPRR